MHKTVWILCALTLLATMQSVSAARRLEPPVEELLADPGHTRIVIAAVTEKAESNRLIFSVSKRLSGESPDEVLLRTDAESWAEAVVGHGYVVAWTYLRRNRGVIGGWEEDPEGPSIVPVMGLGSNALFEHTPQISLLFSPDASTGPDVAAHQLDALLAQMQRADFRSRGLVITELYLRPDLTDIMTPAHGDMLKSVLQTQTLGPQQLDFLLRAALRLPQEMTSPWLAEALRKIIMQHGSQYDLSSLVPGLVRTAARGLQQSGGRTDLELLGNLLHSNNPGVAKAALAAMDHFDPLATAAKVEKAMESDQLHSETRRALQSYLGQSSTRGATSPADTP